MKQKHVATFEYEGEAKTKRVFLAGDFNNWDPAGIPMFRRNGVYRKKVELSRGEHQYKFVVDGEWIADPRSPNQVPNGLGSTNSVLNV